MPSWRGVFACSIFKRHAQTIPWQCWFITASSTDNLVISAVRRVLCRMDYPHNLPWYKHLENVRIAKSHKYQYASRKCIYCVICQKSKSTLTEWQKIASFLRIIPYILCIFHIFSFISWITLIHAYLFHLRIIVSKRLNCLFGKQDKEEWYYCFFEIHFDNLINLGN